MPQHSKHDPVNYARNAAIGTVILYRSSEAILMLNSKGQIVRVSNEFSDVLGYSPTELIDADAKTHLRGKDKTKPEDFKNLFGGSDEPISSKLTFKTREGSSVTMMCEAMVVRYPNGEPDYLIIATEGLR